MSDFHYTSDVQIAAYDRSPLSEGETSDRLTSLALLDIALRTWPYIRPELKHLVCVSLLLGVLAVLGIIMIGVATDLFYNHLINGDPLSDRYARVLDLEEPRYLDGPTLADEARRDVRVGLFKLVGLAAAIGLPLMMLALYYYMWIRQRINQNLRLRIMRQIQVLSLRFHANTQSGDAIYRIYQDSAMVTNIIRLILDTGQDIFQFIVIIVTMYLFSPHLATMLLMMSVALLAICWFMSSAMRVSFRGARETNSRLTSRIQISVAGLKVVKACCAEDAEHSRFQHEQLRAFSAARDARSRWARFGIYVFTLFAIGLLVAESYMALLSALSVETYSQAEILTVSIGFTAWNLGAFRYAVGRMGDSPLQRLILRWGYFQDLTVGLDRAFEVLELEPEVQDSPDAIALTDPGSTIRFEGIGFRYEDAETLADIDFSVPRGTVTAIIGPTGSGKSTLMALLLRLFKPSSGRILLGDADISRFTVDSVRDRAAIALQENILFSMSIRENIRYAVPAASDEQVVAAARVAEVHDFAMAQPDGYETELGERGMKLSTGQRQRLSIARAVLKDPSILILDEPTSALDARTEHQVMANIAAWGRDRYIFLITHRISTIREADQIIFLRDGRLAEMGTHDELLAMPDGHYRRFVELEESLMMSASVETGEYV